MFGGFAEVTGHRYCQLLMRARYGESLRLMSDGLACPAAAAALQPSTCTLMWTKLAKQAGATDAEITEALMVSRLMKMATVNDIAADAIAWLGSEKK